MLIRESAAKAKLINHRTVESGFGRLAITTAYTLATNGLEPMRINAEQIARNIRNLNRTPEQRLLANLYLLELDEYEAEPLAVHWEALCALGIHFQSERVQETINAYTRNLEGAILYTIDVGRRLRFHDADHATNTFIKALRLGLIPG